MLRRTRLFVLAASLSLACTVHARECADEESALAVNDCYTVRYAAADKALNSIYLQAMKDLSGEQKALLKASQLAWLKFRDASFSFVVESNKESRSFGTTAVLEYKAKMVEKRVLELRYLLTGPEGPVVKW